LWKNWLDVVKEDIKTFTCSERMHRSSVNAEEKERDNRLIQVHLENKNGKGDDGKSSLFHFTSSVWQWHWTAERSSDPASQYYAY